MTSPATPDPAASSPSDLERNIQRLRTQVLISWEKEARTLGWFGLRDGMSLLELGSGPGFVTEQLLALLPTSPITAIEINPAFIQRAEYLLQGKADGRLRIIEASVMENGLPDNSIDFAIARFLFQHLPDSIGAAKETLRVLKPGGKLVIIDSDDGLFGIIDPLLPQFQTLMQHYGRAQAARGGNRLIGRRLWRMLEAAGFGNLDLETVVFHSDALGKDAFRQHLSAERFAPLVKAGLLSESAFAEAQAAQEHFFSSPDSFILMLWLMACGEKP
jgi:ubiquinone/menaquinone biosynthesis C-methylase UbiE